MIRRQVIHVITTADRGGAEKQLVLMLASFDSTFEHKVVWLKGHGTLKNEFAGNGIIIMPWSDAFKKFVKKISKRGGLRTVSEFILHAHLPRAEIFSAALSIVTGAKLIVTKHNSERMWPKGPKLISYILARLVYIRASFTICISRAVRDFLVDSHELPDRDMKCRIIHYGIPTAISSDKFHKSFSCESVNRAHFRIGTLARLEPQKDLETLIMAAHQLKLAGKSFDFEVHGEGSQRPKLENLIKTLNLESNFIIGEKIENVEFFLATCQLFVLTSRYEGFGLVILEAAQQGLPILVSDCSAAKEIVGSETHLLFPQGDFIGLANRIQELHGDSQKMKHQRDASRKLLNKFDINKTCRETKKIYEEI